MISATVQEAPGSIRSSIRFWGEPGCLALTRSVGPDSQMPISYQIDGGRRLIRTRVTGCITWREVTDHFRQLEADPQFRVPLDVLLDLTDCTSFRERRQLEGLALHLKNVNELGGRTSFRHCAIVAHQSALFGMARMFAVLAEDQFVATSVFRTAAEGEAWLLQAPPAG